MMAEENLSTTNVSIQEQSTPTNDFKHLIEIETGFWNLRSSFYIGPLDIGNHMSFARLNNGNILVIDTCDFNDAAKREINILTNNGAKIEAVIATHPYHSDYFMKFAHIYDSCPFYGTSRHLQNLKGMLDHTLKYTYD